MPENGMPGPVCDLSSVRESVCIHTRKIFDSCRDKDCVEDLRFYPTASAMELLSGCQMVRGGTAELLYVYTDVEPVTFNRGFYSIDMRFFYRVTLQVGTGTPRCAGAEGLCVFDKRCILFGSEGSAKIFSSDTVIDELDIPGRMRTNLPTAVVEAVDPIVLDTRVDDGCKPRCCECGLTEIPAFIARSFGEELVFDDGGRRRVLCNNREYLAEAGDLILFNPRDNHACSQVGDELLNWRCLHVGEETMRRLIRQITGAEALPVFAPNIVPQSELVPLLRDLHAMVLEESADFCKEELLFALLEQLLEEFAAPFTPPAPQVGDAAARAIRAVCIFLEEHYAERISLDDLGRLAGLDKYYLLRAFTRVKGITPYRYLENVRIARAKALLETGVPPVEAALSAGFADQSHFTKFFKCFIGLTPKQYQRIFIPAKR